jgi:hypothetical protein
MLRDIIRYLATLIFIVQSRSIYRRQANNASGYYREANIAVRQIPPSGKVNIPKRDCKSTSFLLLLHQNSAEKLNCVDEFAS